MEPTILETDIQTMYIAAASFPGGVKEAHEKLHSLIPFSKERKYFGISRPENGTIVYRAAAEEINEGEAKKLNLDTLVIKKGSYISLIINNFMSDIPAIGKVFNQLLAYPRIDPQGYCVEWYLNEKDVKCMVRLQE